MLLQIQHTVTVHGIYIVLHHQTEATNFALPYPRLRNGWAHPCSPCVYMDRRLAIYMYTQSVLSSHFFALLSLQ